MKIICNKCKRVMKCLGNVNNMVYASYPAQWDEVYVCDKCKTKKTVRERAQMFDPIEHRDLEKYTEL